MKPRFATRSVIVLGAAVLGAAIAAPAWAQLSPAQALLDDSVVVNLGAFILQTDLKGSLNGSSASNPEVDFNREFGRPDNATRVRLDGLWRITPTQHLRFMYFDNTNRREKTLDQQFTWGDNTYDVGADVQLKQRFQIAELAYEYAFMRSPDYELAASAGVHYTRLRINLSGSATVSDGEGGTTVQGSTQSNSVSAPLPVIGLRGGWAVSEHWYLSALAEFFKADIDGYNGHITDLGLAATWQYSKNFGVGLGYNAFNTKVSVSKSSFDGNLKVGYQGVQLFLTGAF